MKSKQSAARALAAAASRLRENHRSFQLLLEALSQTETADGRLAQRRICVKLAELASIEPKVFYPIVRHSLP